jgi:Protein of unknown function (DUF559)/Transcriptional regulator, AbiEi antitoxin
MPEAFPSTPTPRGKKGTLRRGAKIAAAQWGVIGIQQLLDCGITDSTVSRWAAEGRLHRIYPGVYTLGHSSVPIEGRLVAAVLHAGDGAVLSHATAAWWWDLIPAEPRLIDLSTTARTRSVEGVRVHRRRRFESTRHRRFPVTTVAQTLLDFAASEPVQAVRQILAEADYRRVLNVAAVTALIGQGRPGSGTLRQALARHQPRLALTRSDLEKRFIGLCEDAGLLVPELNGRVSRMRVDALWREQKLAVELDGHNGHRSRAQIERDRRRDLRLRAHGFTVVRYTASQVFDEPHLVAEDLRRLLSRPARSA